jgi:signal transduction histidine kinase/ActR/RegA family two-component response regulator
LRREPPPTDDVLADDPRASLPARTQTLVLLSALGWAFFSARALVTRDLVFSALTGLGAALSFGVYLVHRARPGWTRPLAHVNAGLATLFIFLSCLITGQVLSASLWYLVCVPLAMGYLQGVRQASLWAGICVLTAIANEVVMRVARIEPVYINTTADFTTAIVVLILLTVGLVTGSERVHAAHVATLKKREATIQSLLAGLEKKSEEAEQARDRAIAASRAKGDFVAALSHEIRTPLNGVLGMAGLLLDDEMPPPQRDLVRTIRTSGDALLSLLNDMLDFSKIEAGRLELERSPFDVRDAVEDTFDLLGVSAANKHLRLASVVPAGTVTQMIGDAGRVRQILVNLVSNAIKFTSEGEVVVELSAKPGDDGEVELGIAVRDTGIGIAPERIGSLFEPFTQADSSTTRKFGGTGLGLAICRRLSEAMSGRAWAESRLGEGSTFHVTLKLAEAPEARVSGDPDVAGKRVLVASPHEPTRRMLAGQLAALGATGVACASAEDVSRELASSPADAVIVEDALSAGASRVAGATPRVRLVLPWESPSASGGDLRAPVRRSDVARALRGVWGAAERSSRPTPSHVGLAGGPPSVLVAEDNPVNQRVVRLMLERLGCRPDVVGNGLEALDAVRARAYDLVLMDMQMPEMDGLTATRALRRELPADRQPLVVAMTANVQIEDRKACEEAGMDDFMAKPIRPGDLQRVVERARPGREAVADGDQGR